MSFYDQFGILDNLTFWDRQEAGRRVAVGSVRELFGRFRHYRNRRKDAGGAPLLVIVGHSFGGMIVYSALAQSLIEAATATTSVVSPRFADLVLLVNPAVEAARYLPIYDLVQVRMSQKMGTDQPPVFVCATAANDWATGLAFPFGNACSLVTERYRGWQERQAMVNTIGHLQWMKTHDLVGPRPAPAISSIRSVRPRTGALSGSFGLRPTSSMATTTYSWSRFSNSSADWSSAMFNFRAPRVRRKPCLGPENPQVLAGPRKTG